MPKILLNLMSHFDRILTSNRHKTWGHSYGCFLLKFFLGSSTCSISSEYSNYSKVPDVLKISKYVILAGCPMLAYVSYVFSKLESWFVSCRHSLRLVTCNSVVTLLVNTDSLH